MPDVTSAVSPQKSGYAALSALDAETVDGSDEGDQAGKAMSPPDTEAPRPPKAPALPPRSRSSSSVISAAVDTPSTDMKNGIASTKADPPDAAAFGRSASTSAPVLADGGISSRRNSSGDGELVSPGGTTKGQVYWMGTEGARDRGVDGLFHDAQDVSMPTLSVYDPERLWEYVERPLMVYMPLRKLVAKPPAVSSPVNIDELPVRCLVHRTLAGTEVAARLVDSPAERYRASFAFIYMVSAETQEHYKQTVRPLIREWVDKVEARGGGEDGGGWLLLYVIVAPQGGGSSEAAAAAAAAVEAQGKIFWWLCADFYSKTPGDRCSLVSLYVDGAAGGAKGPIRGGQRMTRSRPSASPRHHPKQWSDLLAKVGRVVMEVFEARVESYGAELAHLDATRNMVGWDFGEFFVVKESLALMYKELQLPSEALLKYQELAALILTMGEGSENGIRSPSRSPVPSRAGGGGKAAGGRRRESGARELLFGLGVSGRAERLPASVLDYGRMRFRERVNGGGLHSLVLETQLYIFARQCALNLELKRPAEVARMGGRFMPAYYHELIGQAEDQQDAARGWSGDDGEATPDGERRTSGALDPAEVELFALKSSWDVVKACDRYFARAMNPNGLEPPPRELHAIRQARVETSRFLAELLEFAQTRLLEYARFVSERGTNTDGFADDDGGLMSSCVWELQERGFLASQRNWVPQGEMQESPVETLPKVARVGRMRVEGGVIDVQTTSGRYFWDCDEEGEVFIPPLDGDVSSFNPMKTITGGDGVPSPQKSRQPVSRITDFDDEEDESDEGDEDSDGGAGGVGDVGTGAKAVATAAATAAASQAGSIAATIIRRGKDATPTMAGSTPSGGDTSAGHDYVGRRLLGDPTALEDIYLQLTHSLAQHNHRAGRVRAAARCWRRRVELLLERGEIGVAQARLSALADLYQAEGWLPQAFWALHRLAKCRRTLAGKKDRNAQIGGGSYVSTVMRLAAILKDTSVRLEGGQAAVDRAASALLRDARSLVAGSAPPDGADAAAAIASDDGDGAVNEGGLHAYRLQCFASVSLSVIEGSGGGGGSAVARKKPCHRLRRVDPLPTVHVGEVLRISCVLTSHLPEAVILDALTLEMTLDGVSGVVSSGAWIGHGMPPTGGSGGTGGSAVNDERSYRRSPPARTRILRRLESVRTGPIGDNSPSPSGSPSPGDSSSAVIGSKPLGTTAANALGAVSRALTSGGAADGAIGDVALSTGESGAVSSVGGSSSNSGSGGGSMEFQVPPIRTSRSQSLSPRISSSASSSSTAPKRNGLIRVSSSKYGSSGKLSQRASGSGGRAGGRSRSPLRRSPNGTSPPLSPRSSAAASGTGGGARLPKARARPTCIGRIDGPVELVPGETEVTFLLRPTRPGIITASRVSAEWGSVSLVEVLSGGGRGGGPNNAVLPSAWIGAPRPPPSAAVRPFRPQALVELLPPPFLPIGKEGWVRVVVTAGSDTVRGARLTVSTGRGLSWGDAKSARAVCWRRGEGSGVGSPAYAQAEAVEGSADMLVDLDELLEPGSKVEVSLRVRSTAAAAAAASAAFAPRRCTVKAEMQAWHSRVSPEDVGSGKDHDSSGLPPPLKEEDEGWGVECRTRARAGVPARLPFDAQVTVIPRPQGVTLAQAAMVCTAPVSLCLLSCEVVRLQPGVALIADPNAFMSGEALPSGQPLRLAACFKREAPAAGSASVEASADTRSDDRGSPLPGYGFGNGNATPLAVLRLRYAIKTTVDPAGSTDAIHDQSSDSHGQEVENDGGTSGAGEGSFDGHAKELYAFDVQIPSPDHSGSGTSPERPSGNGRPRVSLRAVVKPCRWKNGSGGEEKRVSKGDDYDLVRLNVAEATAFEFGVQGEAGWEGDKSTTEDAAQSVTYQVVASPLDWMVSGLVRGTRDIKIGSGTQTLCRAHLVPIRGGLLSLPRLEVIVSDGDQRKEQNIVVWSSEQRKVLVLPSGDSFSVCKARAP